MSILAKTNNRRISLDKTVIGFMGGRFQVPRFFTLRPFDSTQGRTLSIGEWVQVQNDDAGLIQGDEKSGTQTRDHVIRSNATSFYEFVQAKNLTYTHRCGEIFDGSFLMSNVAFRRFDGR